MPDKDEDTDSDIERDEDFRPIPKCYVKGCLNRYKKHSHPELSTTPYLDKKKQEEILRAKAYGTTHISYVSFFGKDGKPLNKPTTETINLKTMEITYS
jgi:hypothetical protein